MDNKNIKEQLNLILEELSKLSDQEIKSMALSEADLKVTNIILNYKYKKDKKN